MQGIEIKLDRVRHLRLDTEEIIAAEKLLGMTIAEIGVQLKSVKVIRALLWVGLTWEDQQLKIEDLNPYLRGRGFIKCIQKVDECLTPWFQGDDSQSPFAGSPGEGSAPSEGSTSG